MTRTNNKFIYAAPTPINDWGAHFDSLLELKFAISIWEEYDFLHAPVSIYYHPGTLQPTNSNRNYIRRYTPDFLIRHKQTKKAFLIEIKPRAYQHQCELVVRRQVADNFIRSNKYDWKFKVVFDDEIILDQQQLEDYEDCLSNAATTSFRAWSAQHSQKLFHNSPDPFSNLPLHKQIEYLMFGHLITLHSWKKS